jgi:hypothetical protein
MGDDTSSFVPTLFRIEVQLQMLPYNAFSGSVFLFRTMIACGLIWEIIIV